VSQATETDPLTYLSDAFELLPDDPGAATVEDLQTVAAVSEGLHRHLDAIARELRDVAGIVVCEDEPVSDELLVGYLQLRALSMRGERAHQRLTTYAARAVGAYGINLDRLLAGEQTQRRR